MRETVQSTCLFAAGLPPQHRGGMDRAGALLDLRARRRTPRADAWHARCKTRNMELTLSRVLTSSALVALAGVLSIAACTHTTERVVEPVGGADASTTSPEVGDASVSPLGPIAHP